jgi:hypothetical protein
MSVDVANFWKMRRAGCRRQRVEPGWAPGLPGRAIVEHGNSTAAPICYTFSGLRLGDPCIYVTDRKQTFLVNSVQTIWEARLQLWCVQHAFTRYIPPVSSLFCQHQKENHSWRPTHRSSCRQRQATTQLDPTQINWMLPPPPIVNLRPCQDMPRDVGSCGIISSSSCNQLHRERPC